MGNMQDALKQIQSGGSYSAPASVSQKTGTQTGGMKSVLKQIESGNTPQGYANILDRYKNTPSYSSVLGRQKGPYAQAVEDNRNAKLGEKLKGITGGTLKGLGKTYAADIANAVATLGQTMGAWVENNPMAQSLARPADVLKSREQQRQDQDEALGRLQEWSDRAALAGQQDIQRAQSYTGNAGDALIEAGVGAGQSLIDMGLAATGIGGMIPLLSRVYGGATRQARQEGADLLRQNLYGVTSGALEGIIEKATGGVGKIYGAGAADDLIEALVGKTKLGNTGRNIMRGFINAQGEGLEEAISSLLSPAVDAIYKGNLRENYSEYEINEALRSYLIGAMSGGFIETLTGISGANRAANAVLDDENVQRTVENYWNTVKESNVLSKESRAALQRASEEMGTARQLMAIAKQAGVSTEAARALLEARRARDTAEQNPAQRAEQAAERMENNENLSDAGQGNGLDGIGAGEPAGVFSEAAGESAAVEPGDPDEAGRGTENPESADLREVSPEELGITGAQNPVMLIDTERAGGSIADAADTVRSVGMEPVAFRGELRVGNASVNGYIEDGRIFFRTDAVDSQGRAITAEQIVEHELFHAAAETDLQLVEDVKEVVRERMTEAEFDTMMADYETAYSKVQDFSDWTAEQIAEYLYQEIAADAYAGINYFNDAPATVEAARAAAPQVGQNQIDRSGAETRGPPDGRATVAGINARTADSNSLRRAEELERDGLGNEAIRQETGWYRGMDGQWRFEIDDSGARVFRRGDSTVQGNPDYIRWDALYGKLFDGTITDEEVDELRALESALNGVRGFGVRKNPQSGTLRDYLSHPALFEAYPGLAEVQVRFEQLEDGTNGAYRPKENVIVLNGKLRNDSDGAVETLLHEIQHAIQREEGFAKGASPKYWGEKIRNANLEYLSKKTEFQNDPRVRELAYKAETDETVSFDEELERLMSENPEIREKYDAYREAELFATRVSMLGTSRESLYRNTAGEIEARDTAARRSLTAEERKKTPPDLGDGNTVFADGESQALSAENDGNESRETITPQERELAREGIVWLNRDGKRVEVEIRRATTGQWFFSVRAVGGRPVYDETPYTTAQEAARAAMQIAEQYTIPEQTKAQRAINKAADEAIETPPPIGRFTKAERDLEEDRLRTLVEDVPWGAGSITLSQDQEAAAAAETFADERAEKQAAEDMADAMEDYRELLRGQMPVRSETADQKVTAELKAKKEPRNVRIREGWRSAVRAIVNAGDTIHRIARETGNKALDGYYFRALAARQAGTEWIAGKRHDIMGRQTGQGLNEIFNPIRAKGQDYYEQFQMYLYHQLNIDRMSRDYEKDAREAQAEVDRLLRVEPGLANLSATRLQQIANGYSMDAELAKDYLEAVGRRNAAEKKGPKPVFGFDVTADDSRAAVERLIEKHPEFAELAQSVYDYSNDLLQYRVDAGLIQQKDKDFLQRLYPHYVPTFRATAEERARILHKGGLSVSKAIGRATGSNDVLLPLHVSLARQAMTVTKNGTINRLGNALLETRDADKEAMSPYILEVKEAESGFSEDSFDEEETLEPRQENVITIIENGKRYDLTLDKGLTEAFKAFEPDAWGDMAIFQASKGMVDLFKKLVTAYNPLFVIRNALRDVQDAGLYSVDSKEWAKNFPRAYQQIKNDGKYWQMYKGLGGNYASFFDYATGEVRAENAGVVGKIEMVNRWVEAAPRLAEFMTVIQKAEARGEVTEADLMEAFEAAQDVTTNFGRAGSFGKLANKYLVPFLNPSIQGADKFIRTLTEGKSAKAWAALAVKAAALGIAPTILNALLYRDDEEWDDISDANKANNYLFKGRDGVWIKIPKGRAIATLSAGAVAAAEALQGDELDPREYLDIIATNVAPQNPMEANIFKAWFDADLFQADSKGQTWYGGTIETERMQSYRPGERYDESTDVVSKWIGDKLDLSPAKINYLIDQYSGVVGDMLLPLLTPQAERDPLSKAFTIDTVTNNEATGEYYDRMDELKWDMNSGDIAGGTTYRYMSHANSAVSEYYSKIREIEADPELTNREKKELTRELYRDLVEYQKEIMDTAEKYRLAAEDYYDEHPELDHEDPAAVKAYMEQYNAQQTTEEYYKNADQTKDLMEAIVYREVNREVLGAEYALETYSDSVYERAVEVNRSAAVSYDTYYDYYFGTKDMHADRDENGKSISGTKKAKVLGFIADMEISDEQKDALAIDAGYKAGSWKSYAEGKSGGGSGGRGRSKKAKAVKVKNTLTKPVGISYNRSMSIAARTPKDTSAYEDIQKATSQLRKKNPWYELPTGNPELDEAPPAAARYFATGRF